MELLIGQEYSVQEVLEFATENNMPEVAAILLTDPNLIPFKTDGCSMFPDTVDGVCISSACIKHDIRYWCGLHGDTQARLDADLKLKFDIEELVRIAGKTDSLRALDDIVFAGVRLGGSEMWPTSFRWGSGYS